MNLSHILIHHREKIIGEWIGLLRTEVSERYRERPEEELLVTVSRANDANYAVLVHDDYSLIDRHIEWITKLRLEGGFSLAEVQHAYEIYRTVLVPILVTSLAGPELHQALVRMNACLLYTIKKFSSYFQSLHEENIRQHAENLKREVEKRTRELAESEAKYRLLVEEINDGYFVNQDGRIVFANQAFCDLHGYCLEEMIGRSYTDLIAPQSIPLVEQLYKQRMAGEEAEDLYVFLRRNKEGKNLPTENKVKRIIYQGKYAVAGICRDITERIETEKRIRESERLAHIGQLTTSLAHEIRNPLSSVKLNSQIILKNTAFSVYDKRRMEITVNEISRLERILDEMLDFARPVKLNIQPVSMNKLMDGCLEVMDARFKEKGIVVKKRYMRGLPLIMVDQEKFEQVIINILLNAVEALPAGGHIWIITKRAEEGYDNLQIEISDDGPGISKDDLPYVFDPFFSKKQKGTGLGLSNVKKIVEAHGGKVQLTQQKPHGTHVIISLPYREMT